MSLISLEHGLAMRTNLRLVFTNGVFDILHAGHIDNLHRARAMGDLLLVGINSDESVRRLGKGTDRPINTLADRVAVLQAIRYVDGVILFEEDTPVKLIQALRPEVYVKGGDYRAEDLMETPVVEGYGGEVVILPLLPGRSTSEIARRWRK